MNNIYVELTFIRNNCFKFQIIYNDKILTPTILETIKKNNPFDYCRIIKYVLDSDIIRKLDSAFVKYLLKEKEQLSPELKLYYELL